MKITTTTAYNLKFQVTSDTDHFGPQHDTLQAALAQWDVASANEPVVDWTISCSVTKEIK